MCIAMLDFLPKTTTLTFGPSDSELTTTVDILSDDLMECTGEIFVVKLTPQVNIVQVDTTQNFATVIIMDIPGKHLIMVMVLVH